LHRSCFVTALRRLPRFLLASLASAALVAVVAAAVLLGSEDDHPRPRPSQRGLFVDPASLGGRCSDAGTAAAASSPSRPWCTLKRAVGAAPPGATLLLRRFTYPPVVIDRSPRRRLSLRPYPGERAVLTIVAVDGGGVRLAGLGITGTVELLPGARRVALVGNRWTTDGRSGNTNLSMGAGVRDVLVEGNRIAQRPGTGVATAINFSSTDTSPAIADVTIRGNRIGPIPGGGDAIQAKHTRNLLIEDNEIFGVRRPPGSSAHPDVFQSIYGAEGLTLRRNFVHDIAAQGIFVQRFRGENRRLRIEDNVIARVAPPWVALSFEAQGAKLIHNTVEGLVRGSGASIEMVGNVAGSLLVPTETAKLVDERYNLAERFAGPPGPSSMLGQPIYRNSTANDYRLAPDSPGTGTAANGADIGARRADFSARR